MRYQIFHRSRSRNSGWLASSFTFYQVGKISAFSILVGFCHNRTPRPEPPSRPKATHIHPHSTPSTHPSHTDPLKIVSDTSHIITTHCTQSHPTSPPHPPSHRPPPNTQHPRGRNDSPRPNRAYHNPHQPSPIPHPPTHRGMLRSQNAPRLVTTTPAAPTKNQTN